MEIRVFAASALSFKHRKQALRSDLSHSAVSDRYWKIWTTEVNNLENLEDILACILLIVKLCSAVVPLVTALQSQTHKHKSEKNNEATLTSSENAENS